MPNPDLEKYIATARAQNATNDQIKQQLVQGGWVESEVSEALNPQPSGAPNLPPPPVPRFGMWVAFQYIILFISLYISATALGGLLHTAVDRIFQDRINQYDYGSTINSYLLNVYLAFLIVGFPIFAYLFITLKRQTIKKPAVKNITSRKILIYITLVGTFLIMVGHLIGTIMSFLNGSIALSSIFHLGVTFLIAGTIFVYLLLAVKEDRKAE